MRTLVLTGVAAAIISAGGGQASAATPATLMVDDDRSQCANANFTSIQAAVDAAQPRDIVRVCPGRYAESVTVTKTLTLKGNPEAIEALDCFDPRPSQLADADPAQHAIVEGDGFSEAQQLFTLEADDIVLEGFLVQGARQPGPPFPTADWRRLSRAIGTSDDFSGYWIHHNMIRQNTVGIEFGSRSEASGSRFDHNCLRHNAWGLATDDRELADARIDHNATFKTLNNAFEPVGGPHANVTFDHNHSRQDNTSYLIRNSTASRIVANTIESSRLGIVAGGGAPNVGLDIANNLIAVNPLFEVTTAGGGVQQGIAFPAPPLGQAPNSNVTVHENTVTGMRDGIAAGGPPIGATASLSDSAISLNTARDNLRDGIVLRGLNSGNTVSNNVADRNGRYGIYAQGAIGNVFQTNSMLSNTVTDARDENRPANTWTGNQCVTDFPAGSICSAR